MSSFKRNVLPAIVALVVIAVMYYVMIPAINIHSTGFWWFLIYCVVIVTVCFALPRMGQAGSDFIGDLKGGGLNFLRNRKNKASSKGGAGKATLAVAGVLVLLLAIIFVGGIVSSTFFNARAYSELLSVEDGDFAEDIAEIDMSSVPVVDRSTAVRLGSRTIGEMSDLVSQYAIDESANAYTQISYQETPYRVSSLVYADIIKWFTNTGKGLPGYVTVNMVTQETQLVRLDEGDYMHYSTGEHFNNYLYRHVRFQYPTEILGDAAFEIDDDGTPYWIVPTVKYRIMLFGGMDYDGAILVNAITGETVKYDLADVPTWVDKVFSADLVYDQLGSYGKYRSGFWNSLIGQRDVLVPTGSSAPSLFSDEDDTNTSTSSTSGYNYLAINDDVYMYTGMTSANTDESLVGFVLINLRTKATSYYTCAGATETSAMRSAEGQVQQMSYDATSPLLLNIADRPTYFLSLKDSAGLVKMYAFIDVQQYQIVGTGSTIDEAQANYITALGGSDDVDIDPSALENASTLESSETSGTIDAIEAVVKDGSTYYYFTLKGDENIYVAAVQLSVKLPFYQAGDKVSLLYQEAEASREVVAIGAPGEQLVATVETGGEADSPVAETTEEVVE